MIARLECKRCGHDWLPRIEGHPEQCPKCRSYYWDTEPKKKDGGSDATQNAR